LFNKGKYILSSFGVSLVVALWLSPADSKHFGLGKDNFSIFFQDTIPSDTINKDTINKKNAKYKSTVKPTYQPQDRYGDPFTTPPNNSPLILKDPNNLKLDIQIDSSMDYTIYEKLGDLNYRPTTTMSFEEYSRQQEKAMLKNYWKNRSSSLDGESAVSGRSLIPPIYVSPVLDRVFGGSYVDIRPNGFVQLDFGGRWQRINNPSIPIRMQRNGGFEFNQQISANIVGKIGEKLQVMANFDNNNTFDFENNLKVDYTGFDEEIIKKIEIGNVSLPLNNSLMSGAQNLFGVKTQLQFGRLYITALASTQRGRQESLTLEGGSQGREFQMRASDYDENRHFFLGHFFRDNYQNWLRSIPQIISGVNITRVEVYIMNRNKTTETLRNIATFMDLGEGRRVYRPDNTNILTPPRQPAANSVPTGNNSNDLFANLRNKISRDAGSAASALESEFGLVRATDFEVINGARKLDEKEFTVHRQLGYISLQRKLQNDEVLAVAYEYTFNGQPYKVGELMEDYQNRPDNELIFLKMLRPTKINTEAFTWDLMMKNIYALNANQITREGFQLRIVYRDDRRGIDNPNLHEGARLRDRPLVEVLGLDRLNQMNDPQPDGMFDYVEGITVDPTMGNIIFPVLEPFGAELRKQFEPETERNLIQQYVYDELYKTTKAEAELNASKNKFFITGRFSSGSSSEIVLPGFNIAEGSVRVMAGGTPLTEGLDYTVDYALSRVRILNQGVLNSGKQINISYEKADLFNFQTRSLLGTRADYRISENLNIGATMLYLYERPLVTRVNIGDEPTSNMKYGFDINWRTESRFLTKLVDALPLIQTKEMSSINFHGEFAQLRPGTSNIVDGEGTSYIDDFEAAVTPFSLGSNIFSWKMASTPKTENDRFVITGGQGKQGFGYKRAKLAWYTIDNIFYRNSGVNRPNNITAEDRKNHYVRAIQPQEIYREFQRQVVNVNEPTLDLAYFPTERGMYNYNPDLDQQGNLKNPKQNWAGISRAITTEVDFDKNNIEYLEFWMMDPFISGDNGKVLDGIFNKNNTTGGELVFNLGSVSEDVMKDGRHSFENGLPPDYGEVGPGNTNEWGRLPNRQYLNDAFDNSTTARPNQDVGLDGVRNDQEVTFFQNFLNQIQGKVGGNAFNKINDDVSADNFLYYLGDFHDQNNHKILQRYKNFNGMDGNSPVANNTNQAFTPSGNPLPDNEDLNGDNTISDLEEYYEYKLNLKPGQLAIGRQHIVDEVATEQHGDLVKWYLFRIPVRKPDRTQGDIQGFKSIRFVRAYVTGFEEPVVLRMAKMQLVGSQWRKYEESLYQKGFDRVPEPYDPNFRVGVVNIEENSQGGPNKTPYVLPPGFIRDRDNTSVVQRRVNEQSLMLCVDNLKDKDARAVYKNVSLDMINYGRLKMFFHADSESAKDGEVTAFIRLGTDFTENYYEVEVPLKITPPGTRDPRQVWPLENEIDIPFKELYATKSLRDREGYMDLPFSRKYNQYKITIEGRPQISTVQMLMIGIRNPETPDGGTRSVCIWANELRVTDFDTEAGWAANARVNAKLADLADITASTRYSTYGFGGIQQRISERSREEIRQFDISANVTVDKFLPEKWGIKIPMFISYETTKITPRFDPRDNDLPLEAILTSYENEIERARYRDIVTDQTVRRSINFSNVRKIKTKQDAKNHIYDIENFSFTYALSEMRRSNFNTESYLLKTQRGGLAYNYSPKELSIEPFKNVKAFGSPYFRLLKDFNFNPLPNTLSARGDLDRRFVRTQFRNAELSTVGILPNFEKFFTFNRMYNFRWNLTKSIALDYDARANAIIDEPEGDIDTRTKQDSIMSNIRRLGRMKMYDQNIGATYRIPLDKLPFTDWIAADIRYATGYNWMAGAINQQDTLGNTIQNRREKSLNGKLDLVKLYNKVKILNEINNPKKKKANTALSAKEAAKNKQQEKEEPKTLAENKGFANIMKLLMSVKSINVNYSMREGTMLPGFLPQPYMGGMDRSFTAPGLPFLLGSQYDGIKQEALANNWLAGSSYLTTPFSQTQMEDIGLRANLEPFRDMKITLDAKRAKAGNYQEIFRFDQEIGDFRTITPNLSGNYSITTLSLITTFSKNNKENVNSNFRQFEANRDIIKSRLDPNDETGTGYNLNSQNVLIPAFISAYTGKDANEISLSPFPKIPIPNWRLDYAGLGRVPALAEIFASINITHGYNSLYNVGNFSNSLQYTDISFGDISHMRENILIQDQETGQLIPLYIMNQISIIERFTPLIGVNVRTKTKLTARAEYKTERNLGLSLSNSQITEMSNKDWVLDVGYTKSNMKLPFRMDGRTVVLKNDVGFRLGFTIRDTETIQRKLDDAQHTITMGNVNFQLRPTMNYMVNEKLNLQFYFDRNINRPKVANQYLRATTAFGVQVRFSLAQ
jgi:cell surface protein SprA